MNLTFLDYKKRGTRIMQQLHRHPERFPSAWHAVASSRRVSFAPNVPEPFGNTRSRLASYFATRSSIVGALVKLSTTSDERDRSRACAIMMARCFSQSPGINCRYAPTDVVVVTPRGASLKHASLADALLRDARGIVSLRFFVSNWTSIFPDAMSENDFIARDRWFWENDSDVKKDLVFRLHRDLRNVHVDS